MCSQKDNEVRGATVRRLSSDSLFAGATEIVIMHLGESYRLAITKQKKLLLTKAKQIFHSEVDRF